MSQNGDDKDQRTPPESRAEEGRMAFNMSTLMSQALREMNLNDQPADESADNQQNEPATTLNTGAANQVDEAMSAPVSTPLLSARGPELPGTADATDMGGSVLSSHDQSASIDDGLGSASLGRSGSNQFRSEDPNIGTSVNMEQEAEEITVLHPDHPLMQRFQNKLKEQLTRHHHRIDLELRELTEDVKKQNSEREELGVNLYEVQQELGRQQANLEEQHEILARSSQNRKKMEAELENERDEFNSKMNQINAGIKRNQELQTENELSAGRLFAMQHSKEDVRGDIQVMRRAAEKADSELTQAEFDKQRQDMLVNRLEERADQLRQEINMYKMQTKAQKSETNAIREQITEAKTEIESIEYEKKQLYQQWNTSLIGLRRRDDALIIAKESLAENRKKVRNLDTEIEGYKRSVQDEEDKNEKNTVLLNRVEHDIEQTKKKIGEAKKEQAQLQQKQASYSRILSENEATLARSHGEMSTLEVQLENLRTVLEKDTAEKIQLEERLANEMREKMGHEIAASFTEKMTQALAERRQAAEMEVTKLSNLAAIDTLKITETEAVIWESKEKLKSLDLKIEELNKVINESELDITRMRAAIERKQTTVDQMNKKLDQLMATSGGEELGPMEVEIASLNKTIEQMDNEINEIEIFWLRQQHELVKLNQEKDQRTKSVKVLTKKVTILEQKKLRVKNEIEGHSQEYRQVQRSIQLLRNQLDKVNTLLHMEENNQDQLEQDNKLQEVEFIAELKELEHKILALQERLEQINQEKSHLQNELIETERLILLWERKTQLARETIAAVDSEVGQGEIKSMRAEIHRMELKFKELKLAQETLMKEMEYSVCRRENIQNRAKTSSAPTKGNFIKKIQDLKRNIRQLKGGISQADEAIQIMRAEQSKLSDGLQEIQLEISQGESGQNEINSQLRRMKNQKDINLQELVIKQNQAKEYQKLCDKKYKQVSRDPDHLAGELEKVSEKLNSLNSVVDSLRDQFPNETVELQKANDILTMQHRI